MLAVELLLSPKGTGASATRRFTNLGGSRYLFAMEDTRPIGVLALIPARSGSNDTGAKWHGEPD